MSEIESLQAKNKVLIQQLKSSIEKNADLSAFNDELQEQLFQITSVSNNDAELLAQIKDLLHV